MKNNKKAFSLVMAMGLVLVMTLMAFFILEYMIPFGKNIKGIENSTNAYYQAENGIEEALFEHSNFSTVGDERSEEMDKQKSIYYSYFMTASGKILPPDGEGNSYYDNNWNVIATSRPIQLEVGYGFLGTDDDVKQDDFQIFFRLPDLDGDGNNSNQTLSGSSFSPYTPIINWQLVSQDNTLQASGSFITNNDIGNIGDWRSKSIVFKDIPSNIHIKGKNLEGDPYTFSEYYLGNCVDSGSGCILKMSIINKLELSSKNTPVPYLEWKIETKKSIPLRYSHIFSSGKSYGFKKDLKIKIPQQTVNEAFDFTVFQ